MDQQEGASGVATAAKDQAGQVGQTAAEAGGQVAQTTKEQAQNVVGEAAQQARDLVGEARAQVRDQAGTQKTRAVYGLRSIGDELRQMADQGGQSGIAAEVARQAAQRAHGLADHLDRHEPADLLDQVRVYARRRPVAFLAGAAVLGVLAGRMTRNLAASSGDSGPRQLTGAATTPELATGAYPGGYETADYPTGSAGYPTGTAGYPADTGYPGGTEAYPAGTAGEPAGGYEPVYPSDQPGGGFRPVGEAEPGYLAGPTSEPGARPPSGYEGGAEDPTWRTP